MPVIYLGDQELEDILGYSKFQVSLATQDLVLKLKIIFKKVARFGGTQISQEIETGGPL